MGAKRFPFFLSLHLKSVKFHFFEIEKAGITGKGVAMNFNTEINKIK